MRVVTQIAVTLGVLLCTAGAWAYDTNNHVYQINGCPGFWSNYYRTYEVAPSTLTDAATEALIAEVIGARTFVEDMARLLPQYALTVSDVEPGQFSFAFNYAAAGQAGSGSCLIAESSAPRASLADLDSSQGSTLAVAVAAVWALAWCFKYIARAIDETDGSIEEK